MYDALEFEWDADKEAINVRKYDGITYKLASRVWADKAHLIEFDSVEDGEERRHAIGATEAALLLVVHCCRE